MAAVYSKREIKHLQWLSKSRIEQADWTREIYKSENSRHATGTTIPRFGIRRYFLTVSIFRHLVATHLPAIEQPVKFADWNLLPVLLTLFAIRYR